MIYQHRTKVLGEPWQWLKCHAPSQRGSDPSEIEKSALDDSIDEISEGRHPRATKLC